MAQKSEDRGKEAPGAGDDAGDKHENERWKSRMEFSNLQLRVPQKCFEERGATAAEIAVVVNGMEREHQKLRTEGINAAFRGLAGETLH